MEPITTTCYRVEVLVYKVTTVSDRDEDTGAPITLSEDADPIFEEDVIDFDSSEAAITFAQEIIPLARRQA